MLALWPYHGGLYLDTTLFDKAQVRGERLDFIRTEMVAAIGIGDPVPE